MPHIPDTTGLPSTPPRPGQAPLPESKSSKSKTKGDVGKKVRAGMLPTLSVLDYRPDQRLVDEALGRTEAQPRVNDMSRFEQPKFGG